MRGEEFGYHFLERRLKERFVDSPVHSIRGQTGLFPAMTPFFPLSSSPGGVFHRNVQDLQRVNRSDRPGRVD